MWPRRPIWWTYTYKLSDDSRWDSSSSFNNITNTIDAAVRGALKRATVGTLEIIDIHLKIG
jgi:hypothetical protein